MLKPKECIFHPPVQCLTTTVEIALLGVSLSGSNNNYEEMHLLPEPLFAVPTDGANIVKITGTTDGRIFMGAKDGCIYEFFYQVTIPCNQFTVHLITTFCIIRRKTDFSAGNAVKSTTRRAACRFRFLHSSTLRSAKKILWCRWSRTNRDTFSTPLGPKRGRSSCATTWAQTANR